MTSARVERSFEVEFFRSLNRVVEPLVRVGVGSPRIAPTGLIVLETRGRRTGQRRRSPLAATRIGHHVLVATFRGDRSQWVQNLAAEPRTRFWLGGRARDARAFVMHPGKRFRVPKSLPASLQRVVRLLAPYTKAGWAFAVLSPPTGKARRPTKRCRSAGGGGAGSRAPDRDRASRRA
jgi:deazaflavin-dependent oxidoreductase (nitroreductase family)